ncbi:distal tail protein Dit [Alkalicoccus luteus]|nr:distal tail protein Dit [Alkalicoccus luteus]
MMWKDGVDLSSYFAIESIHRPILPPIEVGTVDVPGRDGTILSRTRFEAWPLVTDIARFRRDPNEFRNTIREVAPLLHKRGEISFYDEPDITYKVQLMGTTEFTPAENRKASGSLNWLVYDPFAFGKKEKRVLLQEGITILIMPFMASSVTASSAGRLLTGGTRETAPVITAVFNESTDDFRVTLNSNKYVRVLWDFNAGDRLIIDCEKEEIRINGTRRMNALTLESRFFNLEPGENRLIASPNQAADVEIEYQQRYY